MPPVDYSDQLEKLRELQRKLQAKEEISAEEFTSVGLKDKARLKDIEKAISATKKKVSHNTKQEIAAEEERELEKEAKDAGMSLEDYKASLEEKKRSNAFEGDRQARQRAQERELAAARAKKNYENELAAEGYMN